MNTLTEDGNRLGEAIAAYLSASPQAPVADHTALIRETDAVFDLMLQGCVYSDFKQWQNGDGEDIGERIEVLRAKIKDVTAGEAPVAAVQEWISVDNKFPQVETDVLVRGKRGDSVCHDVAGLWHGKWMGQGSQSELSFIVTHWMHLPPAPNA